MLSQVLEFRLRPNFGINTSQLPTARFDGPLVPNCSAMLGQQGVIEALDAVFFERLAFLLPGCIGLHRI